MYSDCIGNTRWRLYPNLHLNMNLSSFLLCEKTVLPLLYFSIEIFSPSERDRDARPPPGVEALGLEAGAGHQGPVVQAERTAEGGAEEAAGAGSL